MEKESQMRQDVRKGSVQILYEDERYMIGVSPKREDSHNLLVNDVYAFLDRRVLRELATGNTQALKTRLQNVGTAILSEIDEKNIPLEELGWALAKATIRLQEKYSIYLTTQIREAQMRESHL